MNARRFAIGLFCISAALLGFELLLMRLLSLAQWGHFAGFVISIAMLGLSASGLFLHFFRERISRNATGHFAVCAGLFGLAAPLAYAASQEIPFKPFLLAWAAEEYFYLALRTLVLFVPFFLAGIAIGIPFVARLLPAGRLYFWNMAGSAALVLPLFAGMTALHPLRLLVPITLFALVAAAFSSPRRHAAAWLLAGALATTGIAAMPFRFSEYKDLSKTLTLPEAQIVGEHYSPHGVVHSVQSPFTRYLPGLSLNFTGALPRAELVFVDGSSMEVVFDAVESLKNPAFLRMSPEAFSYELVERPRVLLPHGAPVEVLRGVAHNAREIVVLDDLGERVAAIERAWMRLGNSPLQRAEVRRVDDDARRHLQSASEPFDLILFSLLGNHGASTAGAASLDPLFLTTREGLTLMLDRLAPRGRVVLTTWVENPPRSGVRLAALIIDALRRRGVADPAAHLLVLRSWSTLSFFISLETFEPDALNRLKQFAEDNSFDLVHYPGMSAAEANRFNAIPDEPYFAAFGALLGPSADHFRESWPFRLDPPTDDRPFFNHHFRWRAVPQFTSRMGSEWLPFVEWGYLLHVASLAVVTVLGVGLLIIPCAATRTHPSLRNGGLFLMLGVAYMFVELWAIYKLTQLLNHAMTASAVALSGMLAASGAGAAVLARSDAPPKLRRPALGMIVVLLILNLADFSLLHSWWLPLPLLLRALIGAFWVALPAFFMGFPFPFALGQLERREEVPWALALNGFGSVLGGLGATLVAAHAGLTALALTGTGLYLLVAWLLLPSRSPALAGR